MVNTPVLYITFARPEYASQSFAAIKKAQPRKLYFYSNKARSDRPDEIKRNEEVRSFVKQIDWNCEVKTWFREDYVDVFTSINGAVSWIFDNEEEAIIIEEDCVATLAFFNFCEQLLPKYRNELKVRLISGDNFTPEFNPGDSDYYFTRLPDIYGWASWRDRWNNLDWEMKDWSILKKTKFKQFYPHMIERAYFGLILDYKVLKDQSASKAWDFTTCYNMMKNDEVTVFPACNLVDDIGSNGANRAVETKQRVGIPKYDKDVFEINRHPDKIQFSDSYDYSHFKKSVFWPWVNYEIRKYRKKLLGF